MSKRINLINKRFGRLTVIAYAGTVGIGRNKKATWLCQCVRKLIEIGTI